jgi:hypothetical protein
MRKTIFPFAALILAAAAAPAFAAEKAGCGAAPREQWLSEDAVKAKGVAMGYEVRRVKVEKGCYELYAIDKNGAKFELFLDPVTGKLVDRKG